MKALLQNKTAMDYRRHRFTDPVQLQMVGGVHDVLASTSHLDANADVVI